MSCAISQMCSNVSKVVFPTCFTPEPHGGRNVCCHNNNYKKTILQLRQRCFRCMKVHQYIFIFFV